MQRVTQATARQHLGMNKEKDELAKLIRLEGGIADVLNWAEHPVTKKVRKLYAQFEAGILKKLKSQDWTEAEARGMCYLLDYFGYLEKIIKKTQDSFQKLESKKQQIQQKQPKTRFQATLVSGEE